MGSKDSNSREWPQDFLCFLCFFSSEHKPLFIPIGLCFMKRHEWKVSYFSSEHKPLFMKRHACFLKRHIWRVSYFFIKRLIKIETFSTFLNSHQKILQKILENSNFWIFTKKNLELEFSLYKTIFSKPKYHYYKLFLYIPIYTTLNDYKPIEKEWSIHAKNYSNTEKQNCPYLAGILQAKE